MVFLYGFISISCGCGVILVHSSLQCCFISLRFASICLCTALLLSHHSILIRLSSGLWPGHCDALILFFFSHSVVDLLLCSGSFFRIHDLTLGFKYFGIQRSSWLTEWLQGTQMICFKTSANHSQCHALLPCSFRGF